MEAKALKLVWRAMHNRCYNTKQNAYQNYGGRGIYVVDRWHGKDGFLNFLMDMGFPHDGMSIERIDNDGPYSPDNCRWATKLEQAKNKRNNRWIEVNGVRKHLAEWARHLGCQPAAITSRIKSGMSEEEAVTLPIPERPNAKLTMDDAMYVRNTYPSKTSQAIADELGVSKKTILNIIHGKTFKEVTHGD